MYDTILKNGTCVLYKDNVCFEDLVDVAIKDGKIAHVGSLKSSQAKKVIDVKNCHVLPGLIDTQVHFREPGMEHKEDLFSGTLGAICGGITGIFDMPNTFPPTINSKNFNEKMNRAKDKSWCNYGFFIGACRENLNELSELENLPGCCGVKIFMGSSTGSLLLSEDADILKAFENGKRRVALHCEDEQRLKQRWPQFKDKTSASFHPQWRDEESALLATKRVLNLARKSGRAVHILHVTTRQEMELLRNNKDICTVECTPQHLTLSAPQCYDELGTYAQMNPPIRGKEHQEKIWEALKDGVVDILGSDHAPHTKEEKEKTWPQSPSGMPGVQTTVPLMLNFVHEKKINLSLLVELMNINPSKYYKIENKGGLEVGKDADFTVVDLKKERTIENSWIKSKTGWTPFDKKKVVGWPVITIIHGQIVMKDDEVIGQPQGQAMSFGASN